MPLLVLTTCAQPFQLPSTGSRADWVPRYSLRLLLHPTVDRQCQNIHCPNRSLQLVLTSHWLERYGAKVVVFLVYPLTQRRRQVTTLQPLFLPDQAQLPVLIYDSDLLNSEIEAIFPGILPAQTKSPK